LEFPSLEIISQHHHIIFKSIISLALLFLPFNIKIFTFQFSLSISHHSHNKLKMKAFTSSILAIAAILSVASAAPASEVTSRDYSTIDITFTGATPEASYCQTFPIDECWNDISKYLQPPLC